MSKLLELNNHQKIPNIGLGTWMSKPGEVKNAVIHAVEVGYRHIDCAWAYGNESEIGEALEHVFKNGIVKREELFITSKLWNSFHRADYVSKGLEDSLNNLKLEYLDLYLIHWPVQYKPGNKFPTEEEMPNEIDNVDLLETWQAMEKLNDSGKVKSIGVSNFNISQLQNILNNSRIKPTVLQIESNAHFPNEELTNFARANGLQVTAYSPLGSPGNPTLGDSTTLILPMDEPVVKQVAEKHKRTVVQILIAYILHRHMICIPKSITPQRIDENFQAVNIKLSKEDLKLLNSIKTRRRSVYPKLMKIHKDFPFE